MPTSKKKPASRVSSEEVASASNPAGKADLKTVIEQDAEFRAKLTAEFYAKFSPVDVTERFLVDTLIHNEWRLSHLRQLEGRLCEQASGAASASLKRIQRVIKWSERNCRNALKELHAGRAESRKSPTRGLSIVAFGKGNLEPIKAFDASFQSIFKQ